MGRGAQTDQQDRRDYGQGQGGVPSQLPQLGGSQLPPDEMLGAYRSMGRPFGGGFDLSRMRPQASQTGFLENQGHNAVNPAQRFGPQANANALNPESLPITASSGPASTQSSPVAPTQTGVNPPSPASGLTGAANPVGSTGAVPAEQGTGSQTKRNRGPGMNELLTQALRFG